MSDWLLSMLVHICLAMGGLLIFCAGAFFRRRPADLLFIMALVAVTLSALAVFFLPAGPANPNQMVDIAPFGAFFYLLLIMISGLTLLFSRQYAQEKGISGDEFYGIVLFAAFSMLLVAGPQHWVILFLAVEFLSLSFYILIALSNRAPGAGEAALKYFITGSVAGAFLAFGIAILYAATGSMMIIESLATFKGADDQNLVLLGVSLILVGIGFKLSLVPFHFWTPDVYQGAPAPITAFLSSGAKVCLLAALVRFGMASADWLWTFLGPVLWVAAALTMAWGSIAALTQEHLKRLLAYTAMAHMGYLLMAFLALPDSGPGPILFYAAVFATMEIGAFGAVGLLSPAHPDHPDRDGLKAYQGLGHSHPVIGAVLALCLLSLAGLPPTAGFFGKIVLFKAALQGNLLILAVIGMLATSISIYAYLKVIVALYMSPRQDDARMPTPPLLGRLAAMVVVVLLLWSGLLPGMLLDVIARAGAGF